MIRFSSRRGCGRALVALCIAGLVATLLSHKSAFAADETEARQAAQLFNSRFDANKLPEIYDQLTGTFMRSRITQDAFVAQLIVWRSQFNTPATTRSLLQQQSGPDPATGRPLFSFRYSAQYPSAKLI